MIDEERANLGLFVREGEREIRLDGLIGDGNSKSSIGSSSRNSGSESNRSSSGGNSGSIGGGGSSRTHEDERLRDLAKMGERIAMREGRNVVIGES